MRMIFLYFILAQSCSWCARLRFCIEYYIFNKFWYNQFGMTATRLGEYRPYMRTNPLLMKSNLGKPLLRGYTLPGPDFVYGHRNIDDPFGAAGAMMQLNNLVSSLLALDTGFEFGRIICKLYDVLLFKIL